MKPYQSRVFDMMKVSCAVIPVMATKSEPQRVTRKLYDQCLDFEEHYNKTTVLGEKVGISEINVLTRKVR